MVAIGGPPLLRVLVALQPQLPHQALDVLAVDLEAFPLQLGGQAPRAIPGPLSSYPVQGSAQLVLIGSLGLVVIRAARHLPDLANDLHGIALC